MSVFIILKDCGITTVRDMRGCRRAIIALYRTLGYEISMSTSVDSLVSLMEHMTNSEALSVRNTIVTWLEEREDVSTQRLIFNSTPATKALIANILQNRHSEPPGVRVPAIVIRMALAITICLMGAVGYLYATHHTPITANLIMVGIGIASIIVGMGYTKGVRFFRALFNFFY